MLYNDRVEFYQLSASFIVLLPSRGCLKLKVLGLENSKLLGLSLELEGHAG